MLSLLQGHSSTLTLTFSVHALGEDLAAKVENEKVALPLPLFLPSSPYTVLFPFPFPSPSSPPPSLLPSLQTCDLYLDQGKYWCDAGPALLEYATEKKMILSTAQLVVYY